MNSAASRPTGVGELVIKKSWDPGSSGRYFGPGTPSTFTAIPRASRAASPCFHPTPFEKRTITARSG